MQADAQQRKGIAQRGRTAGEFCILSLKAHSKDVSLAVGLTHRRIHYAGWCRIVNAIRHCHARRAHPRFVDLAQGGITGKSACAQNGPAAKVARDVSDRAGSGGLSGTSRPTGGRPSDASATGDGKSMKRGCPPPTHIISKYPFTLSPAYANLNSQWMLQTDARRQEAARQV
jgi:hypothetical protein